MDAPRFDHLARRLATRWTRRGALGVALAGVATAFAGGGASAADPARTVCRAANAACRTNAQCCTGICDTGSVAHRTRRNRCGCPAPLTPCGSQCVDTQTSERNCGACGRRCSAGQQCRNGACWTPTCADSEARHCFATIEGAIIELDHDCIGEFLVGCQSGLFCERRLAEVIAVEGPTHLYLDRLRTACVVGGTFEGGPLETLPEGLCALYADPWDAVLCGD